MERSSGVDRSAPMSVIPAIISVRPLQRYAGAFAAAFFRLLEFSSF